MITLDSSGIYAIANRRDRNHIRALATLAREARPYVVPAGILGEICYLLILGEICYLLE
jgi:hypothetical protein